MLSTCWAEPPAAALAQNSCHCSSAPIAWSAAAWAARVVRREVYGDEPRVASTMVGVSVIGHPRAEPPLLVEIKCTAVGGVGGS